MICGSASHNNPICLDLYLGFAGRLWVLSASKGPTWMSRAMRFVFFGLRAPCAMSVLLTRAGDSCIALPTQSLDWRCVFLGHPVTQIPI